MRGPAHSADSRARPLDRPLRSPIDRPLRRLAALGGAVMLALAASACGFTPIYADRGAGVMAEMAAVDVERIGGRSETGYFLQRELAERMGSADAARYSLSVALEEELASEAITRSANTVRYNFILEANYRLRNETGRVVLSRSTSAVASYGAAGSQYATEIAKEDARKRAGQIVADKIERDLVLYFRQSAAAPGE